jgi:hypothetical protein
MNNRVMKEKPSKDDDDDLFFDKFLSIYLCGDNDLFNDGDSKSIA